MVLYENCGLQAPDGVLISYQSEKRVRWYLKQGLATLVSESPLVARLIKEPKGRGRAGDPFYLTPRKNECVVCGTSDKLTRHHVVPQFFRRHFPLKLKASSNHDVLAACETCHRLYCTFEEEFKKELAKEFGFDMKGRPIGFPQRITKAAAIVKVLRSKPDINSVAKVNLAKRLFDLLGDPTDEILDLLITSLQEGKDTTLGREIVSSLDYKGLISFSKRWRHHFVETMSPQFLPKHWSPDREEP